MEFWIRHARTVVLLVKLAFVAGAFSNLALALPYILDWRAPAWYGTLFKLLTALFFGFIGVVLAATWLSRKR